MITVSVVCDNYNEAEFLKRFEAANLEVEVSDFGSTCKTIKIQIPNTDKKSLIARICQEVENHFKRSN